jgi:hypothetical protein
VDRSEKGVTYLYRVLRSDQLHHGFDRTSRNPIGTSMSRTPWIVSIREIATACFSPSSHRSLIAHSRLLRERTRTAIARPTGGEAARHLARATALRVWQGCALYTTPSGGDFPDYDTPRDSVMFQVEVRKAYRVS